MTTQMTPEIMINSIWPIFNNKLVKVYMVGKKKKDIILICQLYLLTIMIMSKKGFKEWKKLQKNYLKNYRTKNQKMKELKLI